MFEKEERKNRRNEPTNGGRFLDLSIHPGEDGTLFGFRRLSSKYEKKEKIFWKIFVNFVFFFFFSIVCEREKGGGGATLFIIFHIQKNLKKRK